MSKDKPEPSADEIVSLIISNTASQYSEKWKPDKVYTKEELIEIVKSYAKSCVKKANEKQREKCVSAYLMVHGNDIEEHIAAIENAPSPDQ